MRGLVLRISEDLAALSQGWWFSANTFGARSFRGVSAPVKISSNNNWMSRRLSTISASSVWGKKLNLEVSPSPTPSEMLDQRGFCKKCLQNLESKRVKGQNLENKRVADFSGNLSQAASALTIICSFRVEGQGQMSHEAVDRCCDRELFSANT